MRFAFLCLTAVSVISSGSSSSLPVCAPLSCDSAHKDAVRCLAWNGAAVSAGARQLSPPLPLLVSIALQDAFAQETRTLYPFVFSCSFPLFAQDVIDLPPHPSPSPAPWRLFLSLSIYSILSFPFLVLFRHIWPKYKMPIFFPLRSSISALHDAIIHLTVP